MGYTIKANTDCRHSNMVGTQISLRQKTVMNETLNTIYQRRAVRKYKKTAVSRKLINQILNAGMMAPSAINMQPWKFYVLMDAQQIGEFSKAIRQGAIKGIFRQGLRKVAKTVVSALTFPSAADFSRQEDMVFHGAPVVIFITSPKDSEWASLDIGMCSQNIMLAAKSLGLDTCPIGMAKYVTYTDLYPKLGIPKDEVVNLAIVLGYGAEQPLMHVRSANNVTFL